MSPTPHLTGQADGQATDLVYAPDTARVHDCGSYDLTYPRRFAGDPVQAAGVADLPTLAASEHWEDRVRAELLRQQLRITLPDQFPCIYETPDSPTKANVQDPQPTPWVVSPDIDMLTALLPDYQELWDSYTSQWGPGSRRVFAVGRLNGVKPHRVYRPGTTPGQVIGATMLLHTGMYQRAPLRIQRMHPLYERWQTDKATAGR